MYKSNNKQKLHLRSDLSFVQIKMSLVKYIVYMVQTLMRCDWSIFEVIVFPHVDVTVSTNREKRNIPTFKGLHIFILFFYKDNK